MITTLLVVYFMGFGWSQNERYKDAHEGKNIIRSMARPDADCFQKNVWGDMDVRLGCFEDSSRVEGVKP